MSTTLGFGTTIRRKLQQQTLDAWNPILSASRIIPIFVVIGVVFVPSGWVLLRFSESAKEIVLDYTRCRSADWNETCADYIGNARNMSCRCSINFTLEEALQGDVFFYYGLTNFYQNHRRYMKSRDDYQLLGRLSKEVASECKPYDYILGPNKSKIPIAPCGAIANSLFSDRLTLIRNGADVPMLRKGIAWPTDKETKFKNPPGNLMEAFRGFAKPPDWQMNVWELDVEDADNNGFQNEDLIVWMRTAMLPTFRKFYRRLNRSEGGYENGLPRGEYTLRVIYAYPVVPFRGTKQFVVSTTSFLGVKNDFCGWLYVITGVVCLLLAGVFLYIHLNYGRNITGDGVELEPTSSYFST